MTKKQELFEALPDKFNRQEMLNIGSKLGLGYALISSLPAKFIHANKLTRTGRGEYRKLEYQSTQKTQ